MVKLLLFIFLTSFSLFGKEFSLKSIEGEVFHIEITPLFVKIKEYPSRVIIFDFFGANCPPCIAEMPELVKMQNTFQKTVQIIGIQAASQRDDKAMVLFVKKHNLNYPIINLDEAKELIIYAQEYTDWNGALPYKLVYDFDGSLSYHLYGMMNWEKLMGVLRDL